MIDVIKEEDLHPIAAHENSHHGERSHKERKQWRCLKVSNKAGVPKWIMGETATWRARAVKQVLERDVVFEQLLTAVFPEMVHESRLTVPPLMYRPPP